MTDPSQRPTLLIPADALRQAATDILAGAGATPAAAATAADVFVEADLRGVGLQGVDYLPLMARALMSGRIKSEAAPKVVLESEGALLVDGGGGVGQHAAQVAIELAAPKAEATGSCVAGLRDASEIYMLGYYAELIARRGLVGLAVTTWAPLVHPWGGMERLLGTNPIAFACPTGGPHPFVIDTATSAIANGRVRQAGYHDEAVPEGVGIGPDGRPSTVASEIQAGAISPLAGAKGYALSLMVAILCGPLVGADIGRALAGLKGGGASDAVLGHCFVLIDPKRLSSDGGFTARVDAFLSEVRGSKPAPGVAEVRVPGDRAFAERGRSLRDGAPVLKATWDIISALADELGVRLPEVGG